MQKVKNQATNKRIELQQKVISGKTENYLTLLEAALYVAGRPLNLSELCSVLKTRSKKKIRKVANMLAQEYTSRNSALEILELKDERYVLQLKSDYTPKVKKLVTRPLLSSGPLKTLSYIAFRQPISQKRVVEVRGNHVYSHIKLLKEMRLVATNKNGRSTVLKTTERFADYFGLTYDIVSMKRELRHNFKENERKEKHS